MVAVSVPDTDSMTNREKPRRLPLRMSAGFPPGQAFSAADNLATEVMANATMVETIRVRGFVIIEGDEKFTTMPP